MSRDEHELARWFADRDEATAAPLRAEIERLTMLHDNAKHWEAQWLSEIERQRQYIAELEDLHCFKGLRADNERLRAALQEIADVPATLEAKIEIARAALEPKP